MPHQEFVRHDEVRTDLPVSEPEVVSMVDTRPTARGGPEFSSLAIGSGVGREYTGEMEAGSEKGESSPAEEGPAEGGGQTPKSKPSSMAQFSETPFIPTSTQSTAARDVKFEALRPWQQAQTMYEQRERDRKRKQRAPINKGIVDLSHQYVPPSQRADDKTNQYGTILQNTLATLVDKLQSLVKMHSNLEDAQDVLNWRQKDMLQDQRRLADAQKSVRGALGDLVLALQVHLEKLERVSGRIDGVQLK